MEIFWKIVIAWVRTVKFRVNNGGGEGTGYFGIKIDGYNGVHEYEKKTGFRKINQYITTWCMLSIASSHSILTISCDFYPKIWRRLEWKIPAATWNWNDLTWSGQVNSVDLMAATLRSIGQPSWISWILLPSVHNR